MRVALITLLPCWACGSAVAQPSNLHWVQSFAVKEGTRNRCDAPRFSEAELRTYFLHEAKRVPEEGFAVNARGERQLHWQLDLLGTGIITWTDGQTHHFAREQ